MEAVNGNIKAVLGEDVSYRDLKYLLLRHNGWRPPRPNSSFYRKLLKMRASSDSRSEPKELSRRQPVSFERCSDNIKTRDL